jgi:arylsulfatase K
MGSCLYAPSRRPNIIWLQADSVDGRLFDPTSDMYTKLLIDAVRENYLNFGVNFVRHYTNSPQCVPSRTSMVTSRYVHDSWTPNNGQGLARSTVTGLLDENCVSTWGNRSFCEMTAARQNVSKTLIDVVKDSGYRFAPFGRFDFGGGILQDYPGTDGDGWHDGPELGILARGAAIDGPIDSRGPRANTNSNDPNPFPADQRRAENAKAWLHADDPLASKPFFFWTGLMIPHAPFISNSTWETHVNATSPSDCPEQVAENATHYYDSFMSKKKHVWDEFASYSDADITRMRTAYWGAVAEASELLREILLAAYNTGHLNNTILIWTSDHGEMSLENRQDLKSSMREPSVRVPLVIVPFGVEGMTKTKGKVITDLTSHLDVLPTLAELAGGTLPPGVRGQSLVSYLVDDPPPSASPRKEFVVSTYASNYAPTGSYSIRSGDYKLITFGHFFPWLNATLLPPQLFNLREDPFELNDVSLANPSIVANLTATLESELGGSIAGIEAELMSDNLARFNDVWFAHCTGEELVASFLSTFIGSQRDDVIERVTNWFGRSPLAAMGPGGECPKNY